MIGPLMAGRPSWDQLYEAAAGQSGYVTTRQAADAGYSPQLLNKHLHAGRVVRIRRGIYRLVHFPASDHEELVVAWLWFESAGVFSHQTALSLHGLSDALPAQLHLTLPAEWSRRRFRVPKGVVLHHADIPVNERTWFGPVPITSPPRTLTDCAREPIAPDLLRQASQQAVRRGLVTKNDLRAVERGLEPFGGLAA
jgi:predicted transcriptional regulator of viral defense system